MGVEFNFEGKIALVTGASSGLGSRFAKVLGRFHSARARKVQNDIFQIA